MSTLLFLHVLACVIVALCALDRRGGFLLYFLASLFLTPLVTLVFLVVTSSAPKREGVPSPRP
ncbi:hypothetical protein [Arenibaculum pallidiluteum]|uniref:hypothetical protein n=1 Tax=Arenibaculum pallidiluteum TaxID=2812559 RepID=UPI001A969D2C|nr:hypothetical protein [Arenibaculum pallidiluteum]